MRVAQRFPYRCKPLLDLLAESVRDVASVRLVEGSMICTFHLPGGSKARKGGILALGHGDTVWPLGTLATMKFRRSGGRLWGPGVLDMKAGLAFFIFAMRALRDLNIPVAQPVSMLVNPDEETGSRLSRGVTERMAKQSRAVLVLEPGTGLEGQVKTARKGLATIR